MELYFSPDYNATSIGFDTLRKATLVADSVRTRPVRGVTLVAPRPATNRELRRVHTRAYLKALKTGRPYDDAMSNGIGWDPDLLAATAASTGGVRDAAVTAFTRGHNTGSLSSGLHHAKADGGDGFCTLNGLVVAARAALRKGARRVLILDLDAHCGGGTASLIENLPGVEQVDVSVSSFDQYPDRADARLTMATAEDYLTVIEHELFMVTNPTSIDLIIYNAGMDPHEYAGGAPGITTKVIAEREDMVFTWAKSYGIPVAFTLAGGYRSSEFTLADVADLHRLTIEAAARRN